MKIKFAYTVSMWRSAEQIAMYVVVENDAIYAVCV